VRIKLFATARTAVGRPRLDWPVPPEGLSANDLLRALAAKYPALGRLLSTSRFYLDGEPITHRTVRVKPGAEFSVHPPYGGG